MQTSKDYNSEKSEEMFSNVPEYYKPPKCNRYCIPINIPRITFEKKSVGARVWIQTVRNSFL